jgi:hypothetical protein
MTSHPNRNPRYRNVRIAGLMLDHQGYRHSSEITQLNACVLKNGELWEDFQGPFERITVDIAGNLNVCGGTFIPADGEITRLSRDYACTLSP